MLSKQFSEYARDFFKTSPSFFNMRELAHAGLKAGAFNSEEASRVEGHSIMPSWLIEQLSTTQNELQISPCEGKILSQSRTYPVVKPIAIGDSKLPHEFSSLMSVTPTVKRFSGKNGKFVIQNFMKAAFVDGGYIPELTDMRNVWAWEFFRERPVTELRGNTFVAVVEGSSLLSHWLLDTVPKFELMQAAGFPLSEFDNIVIAASASKFHKASFSAYDIRDGQIKIRSDLGPVISCDEFTTISDIRRGFCCAEWLYDMLRYRFKSDLEPSTFRKVFISRRAASRRRIVNEVEILPILQRFGFVDVCAEDFSLTEIAALMRNATHIVAPHGAGLANLIFAPNSAKVLEIYGAHLSSEFWRICCERGLKYYALQARALSGHRFEDDELRQMSFIQRNGADMLVPPADLEGALVEMMHD